MTSDNVFHIGIVVIRSKNHAIGRNNRIPWPSSKRHRIWTNHITVDSPLIMGRKTLQSMGGSVSDRPKVVLTNDDYVLLPGCMRAGSVKAAVNIAGAIALKGTRWAYVVGGAQVYRAFLPKASRIYMTELYEENVDGDSFFDFDETAFAERMEPRVFNGFVCRVLDRKSVWVNEEPICPPSDTRDVSHHVNTEYFVSFNLNKTRWASAGSIIGAATAEEAAIRARYAKPYLKACRLKLTCSGRQPTWFEPVS